MSGFSFPIVAFNPTAPGPIGGTTPSTGAFTTINASGLATFSAGIVGSATNDSATAGNVGEYVLTFITAGAPVALTTATSVNIGSMVLTAGDWDVWFEAYCTIGVTTAVDSINSSSSVTSGAIDFTTGGFYRVVYPPGSVLGAQTVTVFHGPKRYSLAVTTTVYAICYAVFAVSTISAYGHLRARRVR